MYRRQTKFFTLGRILIDFVIFVCFFVSSFFFYWRVFFSHGRMDVPVSPRISVNRGLMWSAPFKKCCCSLATRLIISRNLASSAVLGPDLPEMSNQAFCCMLALCLPLKSCVMLSSSFVFSFASFRCVTCWYLFSTSPHVARSGLSLANMCCAAMCLATFFDLACPSSSMPWKVNFQWAAPAPFVSSWKTWMSRLSCCCGPVSFVIFVK